MRLLIYNIAYGTGNPGAFHKQIWTIHRYLRTSKGHLDRIIDFIDESDADVVGLVEVDTGSYRTDFVNQVEAIANHLKHYHQSSVKYGKRSLGRAIPILNKQANAILTKKKVPKWYFHYFPHGFKKLIIEVHLDGIRFFLVHLSIQKKTRDVQIKYLTKLAKGSSPLIIAGDFNTFSGEDELRDFKKELKLINPNTEGMPTYPSSKPKHQLDFILCSKTLKVKDFQIPEVKYSDHLPLILDFSKQGLSK